MVLHEFKQALLGLDHAIQTAITRNIDPNAAPKKHAILDYEESQKEYFRKNIHTYLEDVKRKAIRLESIMTHEKNAKVVPQMLEKIEKLRVQELKVMQGQVHEVAELLAEITTPKEERITSTPKKLPLDIKDEITADLREIDRAFPAGCYRSVTILCGRILEAALHRKYFDVTQQDILEKNPGIGLGTLIAKLNEKGVKLDPALNQQIHLINQVRIFSVHKKQEPFSPSSAQARAMVLYTNDVLEKMFS